MRLFFLYLPILLIIGILFRHTSAQENSIYQNEQYLKLLLNKRFNCYIQLSSLVSQERLSKYWSLVYEILAQDIQCCLTACANENSMQEYMRLQKLQFIFRLQIGQSFKKLLYSTQLSIQQKKLIQKTSKTILCLRKQTETALQDDCALLSVMHDMLKKFATQIAIRYIKTS